MVLVVVCGGGIVVKEVMVDVLIDVVTLVVVVMDGGV